jgi:hypothetical protein
MAFAALCDPAGATSYDYGYTGSIQTITLPAGTYSVALAGGVGGGSTGIYGVSGQILFGSLTLAAPESFALSSAGAAPTGPRAAAGEAAAFWSTPAAAARHTPC